MVLLIEIILACIVIAVFTLYNGRIIKLASEWGVQLEGFIGKTLGRKLRQLDTYLEKQTVVSNNKTYGAISRYYDDIIVNLELKKDRVTVPTFIAFVGILSIGVSILIFLFSFNILLTIIGFIVSFYFITTLFNFISLLRYEKREGMIMDVEDLLSMGASRGIKNAITLYTPSFHPQIKPYFEDFLVNIDYHGYEFSKAMNILNNNLGGGFSSFTRLAIQFEAKKEQGMEDIFGPIVEMNRRKREARQTVNKSFAELRTGFIMSCFAVFGFLAFMMVTDARVRYLLFHSTLGNLSLISDVIVVTFVLAFITAIKAKFLK